MATQRQKKHREGELCDDYDAKEEKEEEEGEGEKGEEEKGKEDVEEEEEEEEGEGEGEGEGDGARYVSTAVTALLAHIGGATAGTTGTEMVDSDDDLRRFFAHDIAWACNKGGIASHLVYPSTKK
jgi:hypothetical protein